MILLDAVYIHNSGGKTLLLTLLNALFVSQFSDMKIKRTTMTPQVYLEMNNQFSPEQIYQIKLNNRNINQKLIKKTENQEVINLDDIQEVKYFVPRVNNLVRNINFNQAFNNSSLLDLKKIILKTVKKLITKGVTPEARSLGCFYALGTFTIVSQSASNSLPWLYESFLVNH